MDFKKTDRVWKWLEKHQFAISDRKKERGSGLANTGVSKYKYDFQRIMNMVEEKTGKTDPARVKPSDVYSVVEDLIQEYKDGKKANASFIRSVDDALHAFKEASKLSGVYKREIRLGDKRVISKMATENKVYRAAKDSSVMRATREDVEKVIQELEKMKEKTKIKNRKEKIEVAINLLKLEFATGKRITSLLRATADNYDREKEQFTTFGDKGGKNNVSYFLTNEARNILEQVSAGKKPGTRMLVIKYSDHHKDPNKRGQDKSVESSRKELSGLIKKAAESAGVNKETQFFSSHSTRKGFAGERVITYLTDMTPEERLKELNRRRKLDPKFSERVDKVMANIKGKFKIKSNGNKREFREKEVVQLLVSSDINHSRIDVMRYYLSKEFWANVEEEIQERDLEYKGGKLRSKSK